MSFDFSAAVVAPHRMQPGLRRLAPGAGQLSPSVLPGHRDRDRHVLEKLAVLGAYAPQALVAVPGFDATPGLCALAMQAAGEHPQALALPEGEEGPWQAPALGWQVAADGQASAMPGVDTSAGANTPWPEAGPVLAALAPGWRRAALLSLALAEDFALLDGRTGRVPWLAVALPSMWAPEHKVGRHFTEIHAPVADNRLVQQAAGALVDLVTRPGAERWERFVWTLTGHPRLHAHPQRVDPARWPAAGTLDDDALARVTWWRTERQTFIPVPVPPGTGPQAVFTIRVDVAPLARAIQQPAQARQLHDALASMSPAVLAYRGLTEVQPALMRWLARRAAQPAAGPP